jgi:hypothetical protein
MTTETNPTLPEKYRTRVIHRGGATGAVYGLGLIGAWVYFIGHATTFWLGVLGILKGIVWPAMMVFELLKYLNM